MVRIKKNSYRNFSIFLLLAGLGLAKFYYYDSILFFHLLENSWLLGILERFYDTVGIVYVVKIIELFIGLVCILFSLHLISQQQISAPMNVITDLKLKGVKHKISALGVAYENTQNVIDRINIGRTIRLRSAKSRKIRYVDWWAL